MGCFNVQEIQPIDSKEMIIVWIDKNIKNNENSDYVKILKDKIIIKDLISKDNVSEAI